VFHDVDGMPVRMKIGDVSVVPVSGFKTLGEVAMLNGAIVVTTKEGMLRVEGNGPAINVAKGKTITVVPGANAPQGGGKAPGGGAGRCCGSNIWGITGTGLSAAALIVAGLAVSRAGSASDNAATAASAAAAAALAAAAATSAANAATSAANAAASAAAAAANAIGCALNVLANSEGHPSPYTPPAGQHCS